MLPIPRLLRIYDDRNRAAHANAHDTAYADVACTRLANSVYVSACSCLCLTSNAVQINLGRMYHGDFWFVYVDVAPQIK